jgi:peptidylprolyl isomerase
LKKIIAAGLALATALTLSGCSTSMFDELKSTCGEFVGGEEVKNVTVSKDLEQIPTVDFKFPIDSSKPKLQTAVIVEGKGPKITGGQMVTWEYIVYNGTDKSELTKTAFSGEDVPRQMIPTEGDLCTALAGVREGSRIALFVPSEVAGTSATGVPTSQVWVFDIKQVFLPRAVGPKIAPANGMPTVTRDTNGLPALTIPDSAEPTEFTKSLSIEGRGDVVQRDQTVLIHYTGMLWGGTAPFDSSWTAGQPREFTVNEASVIPGFVKALEGSKVGSSLVAVIPPALGYGETGNGSVPPNATLVFVIDILGIVK